MKDVLRTAFILTMIPFDMPLAIATGDYMQANIIKWESSGMSIQGLYGVGLEKRFGIAFPMQLELRGGLGVVVDEKFNANTLLDYHVSAFLRPELPLGANIRMYLIGGVMSSQKTVEAFGVDSSKQLFSAAIGMGLGYAISDAVSINGEIMSSKAVKGLSLGLRLGL